LNLAPSLKGSNGSRPESVSWAGPPAKLELGPVRDMCGAGQRARATPLLFPEWLMEFTGEEVSSFV